MTAIDHGHINNLDDHQYELLKTFWIELTSAINADSSKVVESEMGDELFVLFGQHNPDVVLLRWLRARKWQVSSAVQLMMDTLKWRQEFGLRKLMARGERDLILEECVSGKAYFMGKDKAGRHLTYVHASEHNRGEFPIETTEKLLILFMETGKDLEEAPIEEGTVVIDMGNVGLKNLDYQYIKFMINAMQNNYPECLGLALIVNAPWSFSAVWSVIRRWLDPVVESKIRFVKDAKELAEYIDSVNLPQRLQGGQMDFKYISPTEEDEARLTAFRTDDEGMKKAQLEHREAAQEYLDVTLKWATTPEKDEKNVKLERSKATERLKDAYIQLKPYVSTETFYHRIGVIKEPIFDVTYDRIRYEDAVTHF